LLEESEFALRRDAEQMAKTLLNLREALIKVQSIHRGRLDKGKPGCRTHPRFHRRGERPDGMECRPAEIPGAFRRGAGRGGHAAGELNLGKLSAPAELFPALQNGFALTWPLALAALAIFVALLLR